MFIAKITILDDNESKVHTVLDQYQCNNTNPDLKISITVIAETHLQRKDGK